MNRLLLLLLLVGAVFPCFSSGGSSGGFRPKTGSRRHFTLERKGLFRWEVRTANTAHVYQSFPFDRSQKLPELWLLGGGLPPTYLARSIPFPVNERIARLSGQAPMPLRIAAAPGHSLERDRRLFGEVLQFSPSVLVFFPGLPEAQRPEDRSWVKGLRALARQSRMRRLRLVIATLPSNYEIAPAGRPPFNDPLFGKGYAQWLRRRWEEARDTLSRFSGSKPTDPYGQYFLGRILAGLDEAGAESALRAAVEHDPKPIRWKPSDNEVLRAFSRSEGLGLADLERHVLAAAKGLPGWNDFSGPSQWRSRMDPVVTETVAHAALGSPMQGQVVEKIRGTSPRPWTREQGWLRWGVERLLSADPTEEIFIRERVLSFFDAYFRPPAKATRFRHPWVQKAYALFDRVGTEEQWRLHRASIFLQFAELARREGDFEQAVDLLNAVLEEKPESAWALLLRGWTRTKLGFEEEGHRDFEAVERSGKLPHVLRAMRD